MKKKPYRRKTKIICTLGPATDQEGVLEKVMKAGMNVARFNFSHGEHSEQLSRLEHFKAVREKLGLPIAALLDTKGPEIRLKTFENGPVILEPGQMFTLTTRDVPGTSEIVSITYSDLPDDVKPDDHILIDDGLIEMVVREVTETDITCEVRNGGKVSNRKGVNVPNVELSMPYLSAKDKKDILFGVQNDFDYIAASFTRTADDIRAIRDLLHQYGGDDIRIIAKIENNQGIDNIDAIIEAADGVMVARGDMGVEIPLEEVPIIQKMIIKKTVSASKVVITATQMLDSMIQHPRPTRAEVTDVANAIYDGTSAIMLSGETAAGKYPVEAVEMMDRIAVRTEKNIPYLQQLRNREATLMSHESISDAISHTACMMAGDLDARCIVSVSKSGRTAQMVSRYRPQSPIIGGCLTDKVCRQLNLCWGITPLLLEEKSDINELFDYAIDVLQEKGFVVEGDTVVMTAGVPLGIAGTTNLLKAHVV